VRNGCILIVDDDREARETHASAVRRHLPDVDVRATGEATAALHAAAHTEIALLVSVEETVTLDGLVIAACARRVRPDLPVIFLSDSTRPLEGQSLERLPRRPAVETLLAVIERLLEPPGFRGELELQTLGELLRLLANASVSGALSVRHGKAQGTVWLELGSIVHASSGGEKGVEAFQRMLRWRSGRFSFARDAASERTLAIPPHDLVRETARMLDQDRALASGSSPGLHALAARHFLRGLELVKYRRFDEALEEWEQASRLDLANRSYREYLDRLREQLAEEKSGK
jgi:CheY-like chemotaxis protein